MNHDHLTEEELILHYYGEPAETVEIERRLQECGDCRGLYGSLQRTLNAMDAVPVPERDAAYGARVWERLEHRLPARRRFWLLAAPWRWAAAGVAFASLLTMAFWAGRSYPPAASRKAPIAAAAEPQRERILLVAVGDYLERSQMVLIELANADPNKSLDISAQQERAGDLVSETRLYRQTAAHTGDAAITSVLDELERVLVDITHEPSQLSPERLDRLRDRLKSDGILFKIRVLGSNVRHEEAPPAALTRQTL